MSQFNHASLVQGFALHINVDMFVIVAPIGVKESMYLIFKDMFLVV